jgi:hypothetical protein
MEAEFGEKIQLLWRKRGIGKVGKEAAGGKERQRRGEGLGRC